MTIILHIGTHKTGTTAIQKFAAAHRHELRERGLWYPSYAEIGAVDHYGHHHLAHAIAGDESSRLTLDDTRRFFELIQQQKKPGESILLSAEPIYRHVIGDVSDAYWDKRRAYIRKLSDFLTEYPVKIVSVFRRQDRFIRSYYQEQVKRTRCDLRFTDFFHERCYLLDYYQQMRIFREIYDDITLIVFESLIQENLISAFFRHLQIDVDDLDTSMQANQSLPVELVEYKRLLNGTALDIAALDRIARRLSKLAKEGFPSDPEGIDWWSDQRMAQLVDSFSESNENLRREFAPHLPAPLFPAYETDESVGHAGRDYTGMSVSRFARLTRDIFPSGPPSWMYAT